MKAIFVFVAVLLTVSVMSQSVLKPRKGVVDTKWIQNSKYTMVWYAVRDDKKTEMGRVTTVISKTKTQVMVETNVALKGMNAKWTDSTIADLKTMKPVYHSSYNMQRNMSIHFDEVIVGSHFDKAKKKTTELKDSTSKDYFDSNLYPILIAWLPLKDGYTATLPIYDFNPDSKSGKMNAYIKKVSSSSVINSTGVATNVWVVEVEDEIGGGENGTSTYYFEKTSRKLLKQDIVVGKRKMTMELVEAQ